MKFTSFPAKASIAVALVATLVGAGGGAANALTPELSVVDRPSNESVTATGSETSQPRVLPILAIIAAAVAAGGTAHAMGTEAGKKAYYAGIRNAEYQNNKVAVRAAVVALVGPVLGVSFMVGFENQFYSMG